MNEVVIPLRALENHLYCPRQAAIIHVDEVWIDNVHILKGLRGHKRVDTHPSRQERGRSVIRGLALWSERYGLTGKADVVEILADGTVEPVEYKHGNKHGRNAEVQLCAQALCLEEMLDVTVTNGHVWYAGPRRRELVAIDPELRTLTLESISAIRAVFATGDLPSARNDERCDECQLNAHCLPSLVADPQRIEAYIDQKVFACG